MEMNTRIQVEHPVTEMVYNIDLVKEQIRIASGEPLGYAQRDLASRGHAIECRINAEDPHNNFAPAPGTLTKVVFPGGPGIRVDTHVYAGAMVPPFYDSMIAKIVAFGDTREAAIARMERALRETLVEGVSTTIDHVLGDSCRRRSSVAGTTTSSFFPQLLMPRWRAVRCRRAAWPASRPCKRSSRSKSGTASRDEALDEVIGDRRRARDQRAFVEDLVLGTLDYAPRSRPRRRRRCWKAGRIERLPTIDRLLWRWERSNCAAGRRRRRPVVDQRSRRAGQTLFDRRFGAFRQRRA